MTGPEHAVHILPAKAEFEGDEYYKASVRPKLEDDGSSVDTSVYLWQDRSRCEQQHLGCACMLYSRRN